MLEAQADAYGDGIDLDTRHPYMWVLKPHYYGSHFYNWPYTYGLLFGLGLYAQYQADPERFRVGYDDLLSRAGMDTAEQLGQAFGLDVTDDRLLDRQPRRVPQSHRPVRPTGGRAPDRTVSPCMTTPTRYDVTREQLAELLDGTPRYRVDQVWAGLYEQFTEPDEWTNLPKTLRAELAERLPAALTPVTESVSDNGDTVKFLWELDGGSRVETVLMLYRDRATVCISSQAGCAMGCGFCATGQAGFTRHLTTGEIVEQVARAGRRARRIRPPRLQRGLHGDGRTDGQRGYACGTRSNGSTATSGCRPGTSRSRRSG